MRVVGGVKTFRWWVGAVAMLIALAVSSELITNPSVLMALTALQGLLTPWANMLGTKEAKKALYEPPPIKQPSIRVPHNR